MEIINIVVSALVGLLGGTLTTYLNEHAKIRAALKTTQELTKRNQEIITDYTLQQGRRRYQYEHKTTLYSKYIAFLNQSLLDYHDIMRKEFLPAIENLARARAEDSNDENANRINADYSVRMEYFLYNSKATPIKFSGETDVIKLVAGPRTMDIILRLEEVVVKLFDMTSQYLILCSKITIQNGASPNEEMQKMFTECTASGNLVMQLKTQLIDAIREELNQI